jgi:hypothetical protein
MISGDQQLLNPNLIANTQVCGVAGTRFVIPRFRRRIASRKRIPLATTHDRNRSQGHVGM